MSRLHRLKNVRNLPELALLLKTHPKIFSYTIYKLPDSKKYTSFTIPKKNGGDREILAPCNELKSIQKELAQLLLKCEEEIWPTKKCVKLKTLSHGFRDGLSIKTNAANHINKRHVFNIDLKDFFPSINFGRVRGFFHKDKNFLLPLPIATIIAQTACFNHILPQGSPCSPVISNFIGHILDVRLVRLATKSKCCYSRYADDITFSTNKREFPDSIAYQDTNGEWHPSIRLHREIALTSFCINAKKVSMQSKHQRQVTTGLVVNKKINIPRNYYDETRAMCRHLFEKEKFFIEYCEGSLPQLEGRINYIYDIKKDGYTKNKKDAKRYIGRPDCIYNKEKPEGIYKLYREFLYYRYFFHPGPPILVCEGETDLIYIRSALINLASLYPNLIEIKKDGTPTFKISFFKYTDRIKEILSISSGSGLTKMAKEAQNQLVNQPYSSRKRVFFLSDNDDEGTWFRSVIKNPAKIASCFKGNLHAIVTPLVRGMTKTDIEDLFDPALLKIKLDGKSFHRDPKKSSDKYYGKKIFAEAIVKQQTSSIDFANFKPILNYISSNL